MNAPLVPMSFPLGKAWYVLSCFAKSEFDVLEEVRRLGFDAYTPCSKRMTKRRGRRVMIEQALFPGYVFVFFDIERDDYWPVGEVDGAIEILSNNRIPLRVSGEVIERIRRAEEAGSFDYTVPSAAFAVGESVEIKEGPMAGLIAKVKNASAKKKVQILLAFLGSQTTLTVDPCYLARVA